MLLLYLAVHFLAYSANAQLSIKGCYSSMCRLSNDNHSIYDTLADNCTLSNQTSNYWYFYKRNMGIQLNVNPKWIPYMDSSKDLVVLIPGLGEDYLHSSTGQIKDALFDSNRSVAFQIVEVDYNIGSTSFSLYKAPKDRCNYFDVAEKLAKFIRMLNTTAGFQIENMYFIGVSFGAHLAGVTAYILQTTYGFTVRRITGLDPLGAGYDCVTCPSLRLSKGDARTIDVIHTNPGGIGTLKLSGDIDYFVNWPYYSSHHANYTFNLTTDHGQLVDMKNSDVGFYFRIPSKIQPGCEKNTDPDRCSVFRSAELFAESINRNDLKASSCPIPSKLPVCVLTDHVSMGICAPNSSMYKVYFAKTNASPPYGQDGSGNGTKSPFGIELPGFVTGIPTLGTGLPGLGSGFPEFGTNMTGLRGFGPVPPSSNPVNFAGIRNNTTSPSRRIRGRGPTTVSPTTAASGRRRLFF